MKRFDSSNESLLILSGLLIFCFGVLFMLLLLEDEPANPTHCVFEMAPGDAPLSTKHCDTVEIRIREMAPVVLDPWEYPWIYVTSTWDENGEWTMVQSR